MSNVKIVPITTTAVRVDWSPLDEEAFNGDSRTGGYQIHYRLVSEFSGLSNIQREEIYGSKVSLESLHSLFGAKFVDIVIVIHVSSPVLVAVVVCLIWRIMVITIDYFEEERQ